VINDARDPIRTDVPSRERDDMHDAMVSAAGEYLGVQLTSRAFTLADGTRVEVDGADANLRVFVQVVVNRGSLKSVQRNKVMSDAFKLVWLRASRFIGTRMVLCVSGEAERLMTAPAWLALAVRELNIEVLVITEAGTHRIQ